MLKKTMLLVIALLVVFTTTSYAAAADIKGHWAEGTIQQWLDEGKAQGYEDGDFYPDKTITRAEFVRLVNTGFGFTVNPSLSTSPFSDVLTTDWFYKDALQAYEDQIITGPGNGVFLPESNVTRQEAAKIIANIIQPDAAPLTAITFSDKNDIAAWALDEVTFLSNQSVILGYPDSTFKPLRDLSRAEALVLIDKAVKLANKLYGTVTLDKAPTSGIPVNLIDTSTKKVSGTTLSGGNGKYSLTVTPGSYVAVANTDNAYAAVPIKISKNKLNVLDLNLVSKVLVKGKIVNQFGAVQSSTKVVLDNGFTTFDLTSSASGTYSIYLPADYEYSVYYLNKLEAFKFPVKKGDPKLDDLTITITTPTSSTSTLSTADTVAPVTTYTTKPLSNGSYIDRLEITLSATDNSSGVSKIQYRINGGSWIDYTSPFIVDAATVEKVEYYSVDKAGNSETLHVMDFNKGTVSFVVTSQRRF
ncbi:S-layer homology domain-containing protein [Paenibacillus ihuae]|uniref:S-layer homology domain-containing protein n=1 Tax=Paenibacillus ihuae TaxID=1232431 RepID=UPI0006D5A2F8|nr:S-layer homology domain-containing protein [Paenibacillus ihuae]